MVPLILVGLLAPLGHAEEVRTSKAAQTLVFVRTSPPGASVLLDGKLLGVSDDVFHVEPGERKIAVELEGYDPIARTVTIPAGEVTRVVLKLDKRPGAKPELLAPKDGGQAALSFGPVVEQVLTEPSKRVAELLDLDTGRRATMNDFGADDRQTHRWIREQKVDVLGAVEAGAPGVLLFDAAVYENPGIRWETITPAEVAEHRGLKQTEPRPITALATPDAGKLPLTCLLQTREGAKGVLQLVGTTEDGRGVRIRYRLVRGTATAGAAAGAGSRQRHFVVLVVGMGRMTFEGRETTWQELPALLEKVPDRKRTVLCIAVESDEVTLKQKDEAVGRAGALARQFGFEYLSFVGVHPLGSKGWPSQSLPDAEVQPPQLQKAKTEISLLNTALEAYRLDLGQYPGTAQGLAPLSTGPAGSPEKDRWNGPYLKGPVPLDPWGRPYRYLSPGKHHPQGFDLWSVGQDGIDGTEDDLGNWRVNK